MTFDDKLPEYFSFIGCDHFPIHIVVHMYTQSDLHSIRTKHIFFLIPTKREGDQISNHQQNKKQIMINKFIGRFEWKWGHEIEFVEQSFLSRARFVVTKISTTAKIWIVKTLNLFESWMYIWTEIHPRVFESPTCTVYKFYRHCDLCANNNIFAYANFWWKEDDADVKKTLKKIKFTIPKRDMNHSSSRNYVASQINNKLESNTFIQIATMENQFVWKRHKIKFSLRRPSILCKSQIWVLFVMCERDLCWTVWST